jgi:hypothetical protein
MDKGVDIVGWRGCAKQKELGPKRFALTLKKMGRQATAARSLPPPPANPMSLTPEQRRRLQQNQEMRQAAVAFDLGTPECPACPLADSKPYGCWSAVDFPIDAAAETALFSYFSAQLDDERSAGFGIWRDIVSKVPSSGTAWHTDRGPTGDLAELEKPLVKEWGFLMWKKRVDSAQLLGSLFFTQKRLGLLSAFSQFWDGFIQHAKANADDYEGSRTLKQLEEVAELYGAVVGHASTTDGVGILVESDAPQPAPPEKEG